MVQVAKENPALSLYRPAFHQSNYLVEMLCGHLLPLVKFQINMLGCRVAFLMLSISICKISENDGKHEPLDVVPVCVYSAFPCSLREGAEAFPSRQNPSLTSK